MTDKQSDGITELAREWMEEVATYFTPAMKDHDAAFDIDSATQFIVAKLREHDFVEQTEKIDTALRAAVAPTTGEKGSE